jgi:hypothetical protein
LLSFVNHFITNGYNQINSAGILSNYFSLGKTTSKKDIWMLDIGAKEENTHTTSRTHLLFMAGFHGNEAVGPEILVHLAYELCESFGFDSILTKVCLFFKYIKPLL